MKNYILQAEHNGLTTTQAIPARDSFSAKVLATQQINKNSSADRRYAVGKITLKDPEGKVVWEIPSEVDQTTEKKKEK